VFSVVLICPAIVGGDQFFVGDDVFRCIQTGAADNDGAWFY